MSDLIQLLPEHIANQIAAGEVIQRPASVVKELLENSIDAGAVEIILNVKDAGKTLIQVIDNGKGMSKKDSVMCFKRHATSKISKAEDLFQLTTKGFRGEAMASIASVAHVVLKTKQNNEDLGTQTIVEGGAIKSQESINTNVGCNISVKNLFFNTPARRNFLKSPHIEHKHIVNEFLRVAISHEDIGFSLTHNEKQIYQLNPTNLKQRIIQVFGRKMESKIFSIKEKTTLMDIYGFVGKPEFAKKNKDEQYFFVNRRFVKIPYFHHAICSAFEGLIRDTHPSYFLYLKVPTESIDVNVHPNKTEIKFSNEKTLYQMIRTIVKQGLGQFNLSPTLDFEKDKSADLPYHYKDKKVSMPEIKVDPNFNPFKEKNSIPVKDHIPYKNHKPTHNAHWEALYTQVKEPVQSKLPIEENIDISTRPKMFQIYQKYILTTLGSEVVLIHQNLAHQRILYEQFLNNAKLKHISNQRLLFPLQFDFTPQEINLLGSAKEDIQRMGFSFERFEDKKVIINGIPQNIKESQILYILQKLVSDLNADIPLVDTNPLENIAKSLAKYSAIKTGDILTEVQQEALIGDLFLCNIPNLCPAGKKTLERFDKKNIENIFAKNF